MIAEYEIHDKQEQNIDYRRLKLVVLDGEIETELMKKYKDSRDHKYKTQKEEEKAYQLPRSALHDDLNYNK